MSTQKDCLDLMVNKGISIEDAAIILGKSYDSMQKVRQVFRKGGYVSPDGKVTKAGLEYAAKLGVVRIEIKPEPTPAPIKPKRHRRTKAEMEVARAAEAAAKAKQSKPKRYRRTKAEMEAARKATEIVKKYRRPSKLKDLMEASDDEFESFQVGDEVLLHGNLCHITGTITSKYSDKKVFRLNSGRSPIKVRVPKGRSIHVKVKNKESRLHG